MKVKTQNKNGWMFYDKVREVQRWIAPMEEANSKSAFYNGKFISDEKIYHYKKDGKEREYEITMVCWFKQERRGEEGSKIIIYNTIAYLLNDEGKTIEKI
ncbi:hypothetical protein KAT51_08665 [bacterium]|nr:hypothetical protein [bacterium]